MEKSEPVISVREDRSSTPAFRQREEASSIELFYDLFFVANLTSFTTVHAIDDAETITSYIGFFAILWFTWLQVVLYDIRFGVDSLLERIAKLLHFGVMVTFAVVGTRFNPSAPHETYITMRQLSLVLVVSRLVLIGQYITAMMWVRKYPSVTKPIKVHIIALGVGTSRLITWRNAVEIIASLIAHYNDIYNAPFPNNQSSTAAIASELSTYSKEVLKMVEANPVKYNVTGALRDLSYAGDPGGEVAMEKAMSVLVILVNATLKFFKIQPAASLSSSSTSSPATDGSTGPDGVGGGGGVDPYTDLGNALVVYDLVFVYFFAAAGCTLCLLAALFVLQKRAHRHGRKQDKRMGKLARGDYLTVVIRTDKMEEEEEEEGIMGRVESTLLFSLSVRERA
ncbi:MAG: hypothetical protein LQ350_008348 [Teloschistes chrysophthalmus]|nr:MAG: hypothetical protein LQ350_008348 [Niorma chrysophthalma]